MSTAPKRGRGGPYELNYHVVWCPKYRRRLPERTQRSIRHVLASICHAHEYEVKALEVMPDHVHLFLSARTSESPASIVQYLKGASARLLFQRHPWLRQWFRRGHLWSPSYYVGSVGHVSESTVKKYVETQRERA